MSRKLNRVVFKTTFPNNMIYVAQTNYDNKNYFGSGVNVKVAIKQFGKEKLKKENLSYHVHITKN